MDKYITAPITEEVTKGLHVGDYVYLSGTVYVARDAAHKRMIELLDREEKKLAEMGLNEAEYQKRLADALPFPVNHAVVYYMGPSPAREGHPIGSAGPTTASRMDKYAPRLLDLGLKAMIGKGKRTSEVTDAIIRNQAVYFAAVGGAGALLSKCIKKSDLVCYGDLGAEAVLKLQVEHFPVIVVIDCEGNNLYETAVKEYSKINV